MILVIRPLMLPVAAYAAWRYPDVSGWWIVAALALTVGLRRKR